LLEALARIVLALGRIAPHLLILENLQWADEASLEALTHLAQKLAESCVLVIASCRTEEIRERAAVWDRLQVLDRAGGHERLERSYWTVSVHERGTPWPRWARAIAARRLHGSGLGDNGAWSVTSAVPYRSSTIRRRSDLPSLLPCATIVLSA